MRAAAMCWSENCPASSFATWSTVSDLIEQGEVGSFAGGERGDGAADSAGGAGDDDCPVLQVQVHGCAGAA